MKSNIIGFNQFVNEVKSLESPDKNIIKIIKQLSKEYRKENDCTNWDINNGLCDEFAMDVIDRMGGYTDDLYELSGDMFYNIRVDVKYLEDMWGKDDVIVIDGGGAWSKKMLEQYGYPPIALDKLEDEINHVWIYYNGKHYDAELPNGSDKWYDLPLIKKLIIRSKTSK